MRIRTIKPEFWRSRDTARLSIDTRLLYIGLWSYVDDNGVGRDEEQLIQVDIFPLDPFSEASVRIHRGLTELSNNGLITRFRGPDNEAYLQINSWDDHQKINRPTKPRFPRYNKENCTLTEDSVNTHGALTEDSLPEQGNREQGTGNKVVRNREQGSNDSGEPLRDDIKQISDAFAASLNYRGAKTPNTNAQSWITPIRLMLDRDNRNPTEILDCITWLTTHEFWASVILSTTKLRAKFDTMRLQAKRDHAPKLSRGQQAAAADFQRLITREQTEKQPILTLEETTKHEPS